MPADTEMLGRVGEAPHAAGVIVPLGSVGAPVRAPGLDAHRERPSGQAGCHHDRLHPSMTATRRAHAVPVEGDYY